MRHLHSGAACEGHCLDHAIVETVRDSIGLHYVVEAACVAVRYRWSCQAGEGDLRRCRVEEIRAVEPGVAVPRSGEMIWPSLEFATAII